MTSSFRSAAILGLLLLLTPSVPAVGQEPPVVSGKRALSLKECVKLALSSNRGLRAAEEEVAVASGQYQQARSAVLPQLSASGRAFRQSEDEGGRVIAGQLFASPSNDYESVSYSFNAQQSLVDVSSWKGIASSKASRRAAEESYRASREDLVLEVERAYYGYLKTIHLLTVAEESAKVGEEQLKLAEKRLEVGTGVSADVLKARAQTAQDRLAVINARKNVDVARMTLCHAMGIRLDAPLQVEDLDSEDPVESPPLIDVDAALSDHPDIRNQREQVAAAEHALGAAKAGRFPTVGLSAGYDRLQRAEYTESGAPPAEIRASGSWFASAQLELPLFTGGNVKGQINASNASLRAARETLAESERTARLGIETAILNLDAAQEAIAVSREGEAAAVEENRLSQGFYTHGLVAILDLIQSQAALVQARTNAVNATYDYWTARAELENALGRGLARFEP